MNPIKEQLYQLRTTLLRRYDCSDESQMLDKILERLESNEYILVPTEKITKSIQYTVKKCDYDENLEERIAKVELTTRLIENSKLFEDPNVLGMIYKRLTEELLHYLQEK